MPTYLTLITAAEGLKATREEYNALAAALEQDEDADFSHGFEVEYWKDETPPQAYVFAPEDGMPDQLPDAFLNLLGQLIRKNGLEYLEFGAAHTASRLVAGSHGGFYFRICADGSFWWPTVTWEKPKVEEQPSSSAAGNPATDQPSIQ